MRITRLLAAASFACFGRFNRLSELTWKYVDFFDPDQVTLFFDKRKNDQFREGSSVVIPRVTDAGLDLPNLFVQWKTRSPASGDDDFVFMDFPLTVSAQCLDADVHVTKAISYAKYRKALSLWMAPYVGSLNAQAFLSIFGTKSGRAGGASAACNAGVPTTAWQEQGGWKTDVCFRYIQRSAASRQAVGRAIMTAPTQPTAAPTAPISHSAGQS